MKKIIILLMAFCLAMPVLNAAELSKNDRKTVEKLAKTRAKDLTKDGWKVMSTLPLQTSLERHFTAQLFDNKTEEIGISTRTKSKNNGRMLAQSAAMNAYADKWTSDLKGRAINDGSVKDKEFENFYAAYERLVESEIRGDLKESFSMIRENADGTFEIQIFYLVDTEAAFQANMKALERAAKEAEMAQEYADKMSQFVREGFDK